MLSGTEIRYRRSLGQIIIDPWDDVQCNSHSYNVRLAKTLLCYDRLPGECLDMAKDNPTYEITIPEEGFILMPGKGYLGCTIEYLELHGFGADIKGRSSTGRLFLQVHSTAGHIDSGYRGCPTVELSVTEPLRVYAGVQFAQIVYERVEGAIVPYSGKYQGFREPQSSRLWKEFIKENQQ